MENFHSAATTRQGERRQGGLAVESLAAPSLARRLWTPSAHKSERANYLAPKTPTQGCRRKFSGFHILCKTTRVRMCRRAILFLSDRTHDAANDLNRIGCSIRQFDGPLKFRII